MNSWAPGITFGFTRVNSILERNKRAVGETFAGREQRAQGMPCWVSFKHFNGSDTLEISRESFLSGIRRETCTIKAILGRHAGIYVKVLLNL